MKHARKTKHSSFVYAAYFALLFACLAAIVLTACGAARVNEQAKSQVHGYLPVMKYVEDKPVEEHGTTWEAASLLDGYLQQTAGVDEDTMKITGFLNGNTDVKAMQTALRRSLPDGWTVIRLKDTPLSDLPMGTLILCNHWHILRYVGAEEAQCYDDHGAITDIWPVTDLEEEYADWGYNALLVVEQGYSTAKLRNEGSYAQG